MHVGTILHEWIEVHAVPHIADALDVDEDDVYTEHEIEHEVGDVTFVGTADLWIPSEEIVVDWKTKGGWYNFEPENDRHLDQIHVYAGSLDAAKFGIVYLNKKDLEARTYPESGDTFGEYDPERFGAVLDRARDVMEAIEDYGIAEDEDEVPFEKCYEDSGDPCYFCDSEELDFSE